MSRHIYLIAGQWSRAGGLEIVTQDIGRAFRALGWSVTVLDLSGTGRSEILTDGIVVKRFGFPRHRVFRSLWYRVFQFRLPARFLCRHPAATDGLMLFGHVRLLPLADHLPQRMHGPRWVWTHGVDVWGDASREWKPWLDRLDRVIAVSAFTAEHIRNAGVKAPVDVVVNSVDTQCFTPTVTPERIRRNEILICSRLSGEKGYKGHETLFEAMPLAELILGRSLNLRVIGDGEDRSRLEAMATTLGLRDRVSFCGRVSDDVLLEAYRHCGVFAMPSRAEYRPHKRGWTGEGFGLVYVEAAACGRPVVASADGGAPETTVHGTTGLIVDPRDPCANAEALARILGDPHAADAMGRAGRIRAVEEYSFERFRERIAVLARG